MIALRTASTSARSRGSFAPLATKAAAPATCGEAIDVPLIVA
jgi:hypothetical protein